MASYVWPYMQRKDRCPCELCQEWRRQQEVQRCINIVNNWDKTKEKYDGTNNTSV